MVRDLCQTLRGYGSTPTGVESGTHPTYFWFSKLTPKDDVEAYLYTFEATATAARWPPTRWVKILGPYLTGPAKIVLKTMPTKEATDCQRVKAAILDRYEVMDETKRQHFRALRYKPGNRPKALVAELKEYAMRWLKPQTPGERAIVNKIELEQVYQAVSGPVRGCVTGRCP